MYVQYLPNDICRDCRNIWPLSTTSYGFIIIIIFYLFYFILFYFFFFIYFFFFWGGGWRGGGEGVHLVMESILSWSTPRHGGTSDHGGHLILGNICHMEETSSHWENLVTGTYKNLAIKTNLRTRLYLAPNMKITRSNTTLSCDQGYLTTSGLYQQQNCLLIRP